MNNNDHNLPERMKGLLENEWVLTTEELSDLQQRSFNLGMNYMTEAMRLLYNENKVQNVLGAMEHEGRALNEMLAGVLLLTPKGRSLLPMPHAE